MIGKTYYHYSENFKRAVVKRIQEKGLGHQEGQSIIWDLMDIPLSLDGSRNMGIRHKSALKLLL